MIYLFIILYAITLINFALSERVSKFIWLLSFQGFLLFGIVFISLKEIDLVNFIFILAETVIVKAIAIPWFLNRIRIRNNLKQQHEPSVPVFFSITMVAIVLLLSFTLSGSLTDQKIHTRYLPIAFVSVSFGMYFIIIHKNIFSHVVGYLIIENGILLLSLAVGAVMPMMVNLAILLDVLFGVILLGIFINHIGDKFNSVEVTKLSNLKD